MSDNELHRRGLPATSLRDSAAGGNGCAASALSAPRRIRSIFRVIGRPGRDAAIAACIGVVFIFDPGSGTPAHGQTLSQELSRLVAGHPRIMAAEREMRAGEQRTKEAFGDFFPRADVTAQSGPENVDNNSTRAVGEDFNGRRDRVKLSVTQNLFDGFGKYARLNEARHGRSLLKAKLESTIQAVYLEGISTFLNVLREKNLIVVAQLNERNIQNQLRLEDERVRRGSGITVDVLLAKSRLQLAKERRVAFEGRLRTAAAHYRQIFDHAPDVAALRAPETFPYALPATLEDALAAASANNPDAKIGDFTARVRDERRRAAKADYYPSIDLVGEAEYENNASGTEGSEETYGVFIRGRWEFFSGLKTLARVRAANRTYEASRHSSAFTRRKVVEEVRVAWENLKTQRERKILLENAVNIANEVWRARRRLRRAGKETALNVLDAEGEVFNSQINFIEAFYDSRIAAYRLVRAVGRLNEPTLGLKEPKTTPKGKDKPAAAK